MPRFSSTSLERLRTCDPRLQALFLEVIKHRDCTILEGHRPKERQDRAVAEGRSKTPWPRSKHNSSPAQAVDVMPWPLDWSDKNRLIEFAGFVQGVASQMSVSVRWGGHFKTFFDGPHWELTE